MMMLVCAYSCAIGAINAAGIIDEASLSAWAMGGLRPRDQPDMWVIVARLATGQLSDDHPDDQVSYEPCIRAACKKGQLR